MENSDRVFTSNQYISGLILFLGGIIAILIQVGVEIVIRLSQTIYDVVPNSRALQEDERLFLILIPTLGIVFWLLFYRSTRKQSFKKGGKWWLAHQLLFISALFINNASFILGGGWYVGGIAGNIGLFMLELLARKNHSDEPMHTKRLIPYLKGLAPTQQKGIGFLALSLVVLTALSGVLPFLFQVSNIPKSLIAESPLAASEITDVPNHENTFYIMPIWEWQGSDYAYGISQLNYIKEQLGGDTYTGEGFIKIGRSVSCWYTNTLYENGSYNPTTLIHTLNMSTITNTPILFHMNGGNWGQCCSQHPVIQAMRENVSNCQWDQNNVCHDIGFNPGPNDRFWSFWPDSDWEHFRERNIQQALTVIYDWWQDNLDLLVGFSTDSEIHLNYHKFTDVNEGGYESYFDYNPGTIAQYREWAQANWSLDEFNAKCDTEFSSWDLVDAPRSEDVVGHVGDAWWETWTDFRIWHIKEAGQRQCQWISNMGFPRSMIWNHQILSEPNDESARYVRADPLETAVNPYCKVGVTRYGWISPEVWNSLGELALNDGSGDEIPSWGIFEWNLWRQHEYWAYREMLNSIYQYGGHVICPNEWANRSQNEGLWIPGDPCEIGESYEINGTTYGSDETGCIGTPDECYCVSWDGDVCKRCVDPHGNAQFIAALQDFIAIGQDFPRGVCPELRVDAMKLVQYDMYASTMEMFTGGAGIYIIAGIWLLESLFLGFAPKKKKTKTKTSTLPDHVRGE